MFLRVLRVDKVALGGCHEWEAAGSSDKKAKPCRSSKRADLAGKWPIAASQAAQQDESVEVFPVGTTCGVPDREIPGQ